MVVDCLPLQMALASSLECFYNPTCFNILLSAYLAILDKSFPSRFLPTTNNERLIQELFLENIHNETLYKSYYHTCSPTICVYTYTLRLLTPYFVQFAYLLKNILRRSVQTDTHQKESKIYYKNRSENIGI